MIAIRRRISTPFSGVSASPATRAEPDVGAISVPSVRTVVVFPAPFGPRNPNTSPWPISKDTSENATRSPKRLLSSCTASAGAVPPGITRWTLAAERAQIDLAQPLGVGEDVHLDDPPAVDRHSADGEQLAVAQ